MLKMRLTAGPSEVCASPAMNSFDTLLTGRSPEFLAVTRSARVVAATDVNVLLLGETGTGKQRMARAIHLGSPRSEGPFVTVNCSALPESEAQALLFGRSERNFSAADQEQQGSVAAADGGTLFLDEVAELPLPLQGKLLRFMETGEYVPVGQARLERVDVRIVAATKQDLGRQVECGQFRADLYYRLNVVPL